MRTVIVLIAMLWSGVSYAGYVTSDGCNTCVQIGPNVYDCTAMLCIDEKAISEWKAKIDVHKQEACLEKMEAAMRLMDKYRPHKSYFRGAADALESVHPKGANTMKGYYDLFVNEVLPIEDQWDAVAEECWRNP